MHRAFKCFINKGLRLTLFMGLVLILIFNSCYNKSISNPYKDPVKKPKPCRCGGKSRFGLDVSNIENSNHQQNFVKNGFNSQYTIFETSSQF